MRPVNKGDSPYTEIDDYSKALPYLESALGGYCSYCEYPIFHVPEVEHVAAKASGGSKTDWKNLLLGCKYCNTRKGTKVKPTNIDEFLWPDVHNTATAFTYENGVPRINEETLRRVDESGVALEKAKKLFTVLGFDNRPSLGNKDRRIQQRNKAYELALESLEDWKKGKSEYPTHLEELKRQIVRNAEGHGFFSIWMTVFSEEKELVQALIDAFPGTRTDCFDAEGHPKQELLEITTI